MLKKLSKLFTPESGKTKQKKMTDQTSGDIMKSVKSYRELFEEKEINAQENEMMKNVKFNLKEKHQLEKNSSSVDTLSGGSLVTCDIQDDIGAFMMGFSESVSGHGVRSVGQFGVYKGDKVVTSNRYTIRGATANERDHRELSFNEVKIIGIKNNKIIIGLSSGQLLTIKEIDLDSGNINTLESHDLAEEERQAEEKRLQEELAKGDRRKNIKKCQELVSKKYNYNTDFHEVKDAQLFDDFAIIPVKMVDRAFDARVRKLDFYLVNFENKEPKLILSKNLNYDMSSLYSARFYSVGARLNFGEFNENTKKLPIEIVIRYSGENHGYDMEKQNIELSIA